MRGCLEGASFFFFFCSLNSVSFFGEVVLGFSERWVDEDVEVSLRRGLSEFGPRGCSMIGKLVVGVLCHWRWVGIKLKLCLVLKARAKWELPNTV